jgi:DNA-binding NtrC family response regulator
MRWRWTRAAQLERAGLTRTVKQKHESMSDNDHGLYEVTEDELSEAKIVVVDDEELITSTISNFLFVELDIDAVTFNKPREAAQHLADNEVDLVISDFLMPEMDGIAFLTEARRLHPHAPRVLLTGYADKENAIKAINEVQLYQYVEKPWDNGQLKNIIKNGLERKFLITHLTSYVDQLSSTRKDLQKLRKSLVRAFA